MSIGVTKHWTGFAINRRFVFAGTSPTEASTFVSIVRILRTNSIRPLLRKRKSTEDTDVESTVAVPTGEGEPSYQVSIDGEEIDMLKITRITVELFDAFFEEHSL